MRNVKIYGAGSIGSHMAFACRSMGWDIVLCDVDPEALNRTKRLIYPQRYGEWDDKIELCLCKDVPHRDYDLVIIGTPPDSHVELAITVLKEDKPRLLLIEKPACTPDLARTQELLELAEKSSTYVCVGYNHVLGRATLEAEKIIDSGAIGNCICIEAGFKEHWGGIFDAHPWLSGPHESYLGFWERGGGACGEHSHAINIWQHFAHCLKLGRAVEVSSTMDMIQEDNVYYDRICNISLKSEKGHYGYIVQDVVTAPTKKHVRIQGDRGFLEWYVNWDVRGDAIIYQGGGETIKQIPISKKRTDDFRWEVEHLEQIMSGGITDSPISLQRGLDTMMVIAAAYRSHLEKRPMHIDYSKGYTLKAVSALL